MPNLSRLRLWRPGLALLVLLGVVAAPAAAQEDNLATLDLVEAQSFKTDCEETVFGGGTTNCIHTFEATLRYQVPNPPAIIQCEKSGVNVTDYSEAIEITDTSGTVTTSFTTKGKSVIGGDPADGIGCVLEAEGVYLAVSRHIPHAEMLVEGAGAPEGQPAPEEDPAPEGEPAAGDLNSLIEAGLLDVLTGGPTATVTVEELKDYRRARGDICEAEDAFDKDLCYARQPGAAVAEDMSMDFRDDIGLLDGMVANDTQTKAIETIIIAEALVVALDREGRPLFPAVQAGLGNIWFLAKQDAANPASTEKALKYLELLVKLDVDRGKPLAGPGNN